MKMRFIEGPFTGRTIDLPSTGMMIGRDKTCELALNGDKVSRRHAKVSVDRHGISVEDLQSMNGVYVNGDKIAGPRALVAGDRLRVGNHLMLLTTDDAVLSETQMSRVEERIRERDPGESALSRNLWLAAVIFVAIAAAGAVGMVTLLQDAETAGGAQEELTGMNTARLIDDDPTPYWENPADGQPDALLTSTPPTPRDPGTPVLPVNSRSVDHFWVQTVPPGARVILNDEFKGLSPLLLPALSDRTEGHRLRLEMDGYQPLERNLFVPYSGDYPVYTLNLLNGVTLITSQPSGASVLRGTQLLGRTPFWMKGYPAGAYELRLVHAGRATQTITAEVFDYRGNLQHVELAANTGTLRIRALPAGATVRVDGVEKGPSPIGTDPDAPAAPLVLSAVAPGTRQVVLDYHGHESKPVHAKLEPGADLLITAFVFLPNIRVSTRDGRSIVAVLCGVAADGAYQLGLENGSILTLPADQIADSETRSFAIAADRNGEW